MRCENLFCIYFNENFCTLDEITLNIQGICTNCILVNVEESILKTQRENLVSKFEISDNED